MSVIRIWEFEGYSRKDIENYVQQEDCSLVMILLPKLSDRENPGLISTEFFRAAHLGQFLKRIAIEFYYVVPDPAEPGNFVFIISTHYQKLLAKLLYLMMRVATDMDAEIKFDEWLLDYNPENEEEETACPGLFEIFIQNEKDMEGNSFIPGS